VLLVSQHVDLKVAMSGMESLLMRMQFGFITYTQKRRCRRGWINAVDASDLYLRRDAAMMADL